jgi:hypothetical protein
MEQPGSARRGGGIRSAGFWMAVGAVALILASAWFYHFHYQRQIGPAQPVSFSHRVHAGDKEISCFVCHAEVAGGSRAGVPPVQTCMLCHEKVIITHPEVEKVRKHYFRGEPIEWLQVYDVPEFVFFNHEAHVRRQVDCGTCHGNVKAMDRLIPAQDFTMGFCVQCHRDNQVSHDCFMCHR